VGLRKVGVLRTVGYIGAILMIFVLFIQALLVVVKLLVPGFDPDQAQTNEFTQNVDTHRSLALMALVVLPPIFEEIIFRGFIFPAISRRTGIIWGAILSSVLFGLAHGQANIIVYTFPLGLVLCFLYFRTKSIVPGIALHMINNLLAFVAMSQK
jgi:membrane protease YdiL (CAAX protease family)